jgi:hypothetical protein
MIFQPTQKLVLLAGLICVPLACGPGNGTSLPKVEEADLADSVFLAPPVEWGGSFLICFRFEVTQAEFGAAGLDEEGAVLPVVAVNRRQAQTWSESLGMRLPTEIEWLHLRTAGGSERSHNEDANTLELGLAKPLPVGVFESGRSPLGGYDFDGNVWEWLADGEAEGARQIGGSFASYGSRSGSVPVRTAHESDQASDVGFRPVADALPWLRLRIEPAWRQAPETERAAFASAVGRWRPELRRQLAHNWRTAYPEALDFADFLEGSGP